MPFIKGQSANPAGRGKGTPNKITRDVKEALQAFIDHNTATLQVTFDQLEAKDKMRVYIDLLPYLVPKLQSTSFEVPEEIKPITIVIQQSDIPILESNFSEE